jgi:hypothetical protein
MTCRGKTDGGGAQAHAMMSTIAFADYMGVGYVHTPFSSVEHNDEGRDDWASSWERFLNLGMDEVSRESVREMPVVALRKLKHWKRRENMLVEVPFCHDFTDVFPETYRRIQPRLRAKYWAADKSAYDPLYVSGKKSIAVHIRRGDVSNSENAKRFTDNSEVLKRLERIISEMDEPRERLDIRVYSQGDESDFREFARMGASLHINEDVFSTLHALVCADVLVMSKSSMSYVAGVLSEGVVVYEPFWHAPLPGWIVSGTE